MFFWNGISFDDIFEPYRWGTKTSPTGLQIDGVDICNRYQSTDGEWVGADTPFVVGGQNLRYKFVKKGGVILGQYYTQLYGSGYFQPPKSSFYVVLGGAGGGGGGGGGNSGNDYHSASGGGGGGAGSVIGFTVYMGSHISSVYYNIAWGSQPGAGGANGNGSPGANGASSIFGEPGQPWYNVAAGGTGGGGGFRSSENHLIGTPRGGRGGDGSSSVKTLNPPANPGEASPARAASVATLPSGVSFTLIQANGSVSGGAKGTETYITNGVYAGGGGGGAGANGYGAGGAGGHGGSGLYNYQHAVGADGGYGAGGGGGGGAGSSTQKVNGARGGYGGQGFCFIYV